MMPVETLGCGCIVDSLGKVTPCAQHVWNDAVRCRGTQATEKRIAELEAALTSETQARQEAENEARMGHVRLDECSDGVETKGKPLYDRISAKIQKMAEENSERGHIIAAMGAEQDELRARAESAKHRQAAAEYRAQRIVLDEELRAQLTTERSARQQAERALSATKARLDGWEAASSGQPCDEFGCPLPNKGYASTSENFQWSVGYRAFVASELYTVMVGRADKAQALSEQLTAAEQARARAEQELARQASAPPVTTLCEWPACINEAVCTSGSFGGRLVCREHFAITNGPTSAPAAARTPSPDET